MRNAEFNRRSPTRQTGSVPTQGRRFIHGTLDTKLTYPGFGGINPSCATLTVEKTNADGDYVASAEKATVKARQEDHAFAPGQRLVCARVNREWRPVGFSYGWRDQNLQAVADFAQGSFGNVTFVPLFDGTLVENLPGFPATFTGASTGSAYKINLHFYGQIPYTVQVIGMLESGGPNDDGFWYPATNGKFEHVSVIFDIKLAGPLINYFGINTLIVLKQNGKYFTATFSGVDDNNWTGSTSETDWETVFGITVGANEFSPWLPDGSPGTGSVDFSETGSPIQIGFGVYFHETTSSGSPGPLEIQIRNLAVAIGPQCTI